MKYWKICFSGLWLGGKAVVVAETSDEAIEELKKHSQWQNEWKILTVHEIDSEQRVLYFDNGNY